MRTNVWGFSISPIHIFILAIALIFLYGLTLKCCPLKDNLQTKIIPGTDIDWWSVLHIVLFAILGYLFPGNFLMFFLLGAVWEVIEWGTGNPDLREALLGFKFRDNKYWFGRVSDILMNGVGLAIGEYLAIKFPRNRNGQPV